MMNQIITRKTALVALAALLWLLPLGASAQTVRGDFDYDGDFDISDLTLLINRLLNDEWNDIPQDVERETVTVNGVPFVMVHVEGGTLTHEDGAMYVLNDYWMGETEVTRELWSAVMGGSDNSRLPASEKSWNDCQAFIDSLNALTGRTFRLPRCAEWEFAARGGNRSRGYTYCGGNDLDVVGWYCDNANEIREVGLLKCNELGLYDMSGNVWEWSQDTYPTSSGSEQKWYCGGKGNSLPAANTPSERDHYYRHLGPTYSGFRLAM
ncbi:MAG: SUMF1/EgtB/PvdO family nonheme iron enzyme [Muribaculaceae bacterium]|nr:SUMF1/EgtB/PvdO family nonheme iron enzyme [Muribaculaceae bacterium]